MVGSISGLGTTFNLPNFLGLLYNITPTDTKFLSAIGGLTGGGNFTAGMGDSSLFSWQEEDLRSAARRTHAEGADAPTASSRTRSVVYNVLQIIHESINISYTKQAAVGQIADVGSNHPNVASTTGNQPVQNEMQRQIMLRMREIARDVEYSFLNGVFNEPSDNNTNRETRGLLAATTTNVEDAQTVEESVDSVDTTSDEIGVADGSVFAVDDQVEFTGTSGTDFPSDLDENTTYYIVNVATNEIQVSETQGGTAIDLTDASTGGTVVKSADLTKDMINNLGQQVWESGGMQEQETATLMVNAWQRRKLTELYIGTDVYRQSSRTVGGVVVDTIMTDFGELNVMLNRHMPKNRLQVVSLEWCSPVHLLVPGKGFLFVEPLGKDGARDESQIYGEIGLYYGNERAHGKVRHLAYTDV